jgi:hypothetical protein
MALVSAGNGEKDHRRWAQRLRNSPCSRRRSAGDPSGPVRGDPSGPVRGGAPWRSEWHLFAAPVRGCTCSAAPVRLAVRLAAISGAARLFELPVGPSGLRLRRCPKEPYPPNSLSAAAAKRWRSWEMRARAGPESSRRARARRSPRGATYSAGESPQKTSPPSKDQRIAGTESASRSPAREEPPPAHFRVRSRYERVSGAADCVSRQKNACRRSPKAVFLS